MPRPILETIPEYPSEARKTNVQGTVELNVKIDENGKVVNVKVLRNTTESNACAQSAIAAAFRSRYQPAQTPAGPDTAWVVRQYRFSLNE
jgi:TonB family protein